MLVSIVNFLVPLSVFYVVEIHSKNLRKQRHLDPAVIAIGSTIYQVHFAPSRFEIFFSTISFSSRGVYDFRRSSIFFRVFVQFHDPSFRDFPGQFGIARLVVDHTDPPVEQCQPVLSQRHRATHQKCLYSVTPAGWIFLE